MPLFLQFVDLYGAPVYVRPERVDAIKSIAVTWNGEVKRGALIVMTNREAFRVRGDADQVADAIEQWHREEARNSEYCDRCPALAKETDGTTLYHVDPALSI